MTYEDLFDLTQTNHARLFAGTTYGWEVLPLIAEYVAQQTSSTPQHMIVGEGTVIEPGATINGPAIIGKNCIIRAGAYIRENVIIGDNCVIGHASELKHVLLFNDVFVPHFNYVGDSILGYKAHLGAGVVLSNFKSFNDTIRVQWNDHVHDTGLEKFGALIGDHVEIGSNAVCNPGTIIGRRSIIYPLALVRGTVAADLIVKVRQTQEIVDRR